MSQEPPGSQWPPTAPQQAWDPGRQQRQPPQHPQHSQQRPVPAPIAQSFAPARQRDPVVRVSIWRIALGIWLGAMLVGLTLLVIGIGLAAAFPDSFRSDLGVTTDSPGLFDNN